MKDDGQTIAALLTPLSPGAIAVIGIAGLKSETILAEILRRASGDTPPRLSDRHPTFCRLMDGDAVLDEVVAVRIRRGNSYTAEINTHGGVRIAQRSLQLLARNGARIVRADEFIEGTSANEPVERAVDRALLKSGSRRLTAWLLAQRRILAPFLSRLQTVDEGEKAAFRERSRVAIRMLEGMNVAIVGPPNAGKSTLANRLMGIDRVITSDRPGTTRDWVSETALIKGWPVTLTDTAGIRETTCEIESEAIRRAHARADAADVVLIVVDAMEPHGVRQRQADRIKARLSVNRPHLMLLNKCDLLSAESVRIGSEALRVSGLTGMGFDDLEQRLAAVLGLELLDGERPAAVVPSQLA